MTEKFCRSMVYKILEGIQTRAGSSSLVEFLMGSPKVRWSTSSLGSAEFLLFSLFTFIPHRRSEKDKKVGKWTRPTKAWAAPSPMTRYLQISPHLRRKPIPQCLDPSLVPHLQCEMYFFLLRRCWKQRVTLDYINKLFNVTHSIDKAEPVSNSLCTDPYI